MKSRSIGVQLMVKTALCIALTAVITMLAIPVPFTGGYIHLGDSMVFLGVFLLGARAGALSAAIGPALADVILGYAQWAPFTFVIKGLMALVMGLVIEKAVTGARLTAASVLICAGWAAFNFAVRFLVAHQAAHAADSLMSAAMSSKVIDSASEFEDFALSAQSKLMICAIAVPLVLAAIMLVMRLIYGRRDHKPRIYLFSLRSFAGMTGAGFVMIFGYYLAGGILLGGGAGSFAMSAFSIPANVLQFTAGFVIAALLSSALSGTKLFAVSDKANKLS